MAGQNEHVKIMKDLEARAAMDVYSSSTGVRASCSDESSENWCSLSVDTSWMPIATPA